MAGRVADERRHCFDAAIGEYTVDEFLAFGEGFVPGNLTPGVALADHGGADAVRILVQFAEGGALRADESLRPHVLAVRSDELHMVVGVD
ncbi:unannotated protein [freshwater metagenome]|uniref:Unannotated protein n=1 Tax=freshwater metagenome TaxID=449393 RepID=A0A6J5YGN7_9ZZZZ